MNQPDVLKDYCKINKDGSLEGQYAKLFEQAIRIEGTYKSQGKHAAGVVISSRNLSEVCPMVRETKGAERIAGMEMTDLESMGHVKFDILGVNLLDKIMGIRSFRKTLLYQVHCDDTRVKYSELYESIDEAVDKFLELKRKIR